MSLLGIDLGGTKLGISQFNLQGVLLHKDSIPLAGRVGKEVGSLITDTIVDVIRANEHSDNRILSIGVSVPGISRIKSGTVWAPNIPAWENYPLLAEVQKVSGNIPVTIESDRACSIMGEIWQGKASGCNDAIFVAVGTGIGAGILVNGTILRGAHDISGAIGWMALKQPFKNEYIQTGCFEYYASGNGISRVAQTLLQDKTEYRGELRNKDLEEVSSHDVFAAYDKNDPIATETLNICISMWGMAVANLVSIFNPEKIIFGGGVFGPATRFIPAIAKEALKWAQPISIQQVSIESSALGTEAGVYGAAYIALQAIRSSV